jgi:DNA-binding FadR family transcriptional regulator
MKAYVGRTMPDTEPDYRHLTVDFHRAVYQLAANPVVVLLTQAVTPIVTSHVVPAMDPVALRPTIVEEHRELARTIAAGHPDRARRLMALHFGAQHAYYRAHWPDRLQELIEWR